MRTAPACRSRTMAIASRSVSSTVRSLVSRTMASAAGSNGFTFASFVSRRSSASSTSSGSVDPSLLRASLPALVRLRGQEQLDGRVGEDDRADVSTLDHRAREAERTLTFTHQGADLRVTGDVRHLTLDPVAHERGGRRGTLDLDLGRGRRSTGRTSTSTSTGRARRRRRGRRPRSSAASVSARYMMPVLTYGRPSASARPRASVLLPGPRRSVDRDDPQPRHVASSTDAPSARMASTNPGNDTSAASMPSISLGPVRRQRPDRERHREPMVAAAVGDPSAQTQARHHEVVALDPGVPAQRPQIPRPRPSSRSVSLARSSAAPVNHVSPRACAATHGEDRDLVDHERELRRLDPRSPQVRAGRHPQLADRLPQLLPDRTRLGPHPHPLHHVQEVQPARVQPDLVEPSAPSRSARPPPPGTPRRRRPRARCRRTRRADTRPAA